jgi:hypothetical protein
MDAPHRHELPTAQRVCAPPQTHGRRTSTGANWYAMVASCASRRMIMAQIDLVGACHPHGYWLLHIAQIGGYVCDPSAPSCHVWRWSAPPTARSVRARSADTAGRSVAWHGRYAQRAPQEGASRSLGPARSRHGDRRRKQWLAAGAGHQHRGYRQQAGGQRARLRLALPQARDMSHPWTATWRAATAAMTLAASGQPAISTTWRWWPGLVQASSSSPSKMRSGRAARIEDDFMIAEHGGCVIATARYSSQAGADG